MHNARITLLVASGATWLGGWTAVATHYSRRRGAPRWTTARTFPWKHFSTTEWLLLALTIVVSFALLVTGLRIEAP